MSFDINEEKTDDFEKDAIYVYIYIWVIPPRANTNVVELNDFSQADLVER